MVLHHSKLSWKITIFHTLFSYVYHIPQISPGSAIIVLGANLDFFLPPHSIISCDVTGYQGRLIVWPVPMTLRALVVFTPDLIEYYNEKSVWWSIIFHDNLLWWSTIRSANKKSKLSYRTLQHMVLIISEYYYHHNFKNAFVCGAIQKYFNITK